MIEGDMIKILTDYKTKEKFRIATTGNNYLPCFGEDGIVYMWLTNLCYCGTIVRDDCRILDLEQKIGLMPMTLADGETIERWDTEGSNFNSLEDIEKFINKEDL